MKKIININLIWGIIYLTLGFMLCCRTSKTNDANTNDGWLKKLPPCPCENPDKNGVRLNDGWAKDKGDISKYHKGANECYRSYPTIQTAEGLSGQQCCYDYIGKLITEGSGAGTPDKESTCDGEDSDGVMKLRYSGVFGHLNKDVRPWERYGGVDRGWIRYNLIWKPNNENNCTPNKIEN